MIQMSQTLIGLHLSQATSPSLVEPRQTPRLIRGARHPDRFAAA
jgi:hypothetical protein